VTPAFPPGHDPMRMLLSLTAADALGAATEFKTPGEIQRRYGLIEAYQPGSPFGFEPGEGTDDSQMTVATLLGYARNEGPSGILLALRAWLDADPPDAGNLTRSALRYGRLDGGYRAWRDSGGQSAGNGGLMRIAACRVAGFQGDALRREAAVVTALTHADPRCVHASVFFVSLLERLERGEAYALSVTLALDDASKFDAVPALVSAGLLSAGETSYRSFLAAAWEAVRGAALAGLQGVVTSQSGYVLDTLQAAVAHGRGRNWLACVQPAVMLGDDSDTAACVTGAIAAARGYEAPAHLLPPLRLGHTWSGWERTWFCTEHYPRVLEKSRVTT